MNEFRDMGFQVGVKSMHARRVRNTIFQGGTPKFRWPELVLKAPCAIIQISVRPTHCGVPGLYHMLVIHGELYPHLPEQSHLFIDYFIYDDF